MNRITACASALTLLLSASPRAQDPAPQSGPPRRGGRAQGVRPAELAAMLDAWAIVQAQTALQLNDGQCRSSTRLKRLQDTRRRNGQIRNRLLAQIRAVVRA